MGWDWYQYLNPIDPLLQDLTEVNPPENRQLGSEIRQILGLSGNIFDNRAEYDPKYAALGNRTTGISLFGDGSTPGMLEMYQNALPGLTNAQVGAGQGALQQYGGSIASAVRGINPNQSNLMDLMNKQATEGLQAGGRMTRDQMYNATNAVRSNYANRGFVGSLPQGLDESVALARESDNVLGQRQNFAAGVAGMENQFYTNPAVNYALGTGSQNSMNSVLGMGMANTANTPNALDQVAPYASDVNNTNYNGVAAAEIAQANNRTGMMSSMMSY